MKQNLGWVTAALLFAHAGLRFCSVTLGPATTQPRNVLLHFARSLSADGKKKKYNNLKEKIF